MLLGLLFKVTVFVLSKPLRLVVFASGNGSNFEAIQTAITKGILNAEILCLISDKKDAYAHERAKRHEIPSHSFKEASKQAYEEAILQTLLPLSFDYIVCAGYMKIIGPSLLHHYEGKILNIHPSHLPKYKGLHALEQALEAGEKEIGVSVHYVDETLDGGAIIDQVLFPIEEEMDKSMIETILHQHEHQLYVSVLQQLGRQNI